MTDLDGERYCFIAEWFDALAQINKQYYLNYYVNSKSTEMIDVKYKKLFLKKSKVDTVHTDNLYIGSTVHVYCRPLTIVDFGDEYTRKKLGSQKEKTIAIVKPDTVNKFGEIVSYIIDNGYLITKMKMIMLDRKEASDFYIEHLGKIFFDNMLTFLSSGPIVVIEIQGIDAVEWWRRAIGPTDPVEARREQPRCIRAKYGKEKTANAVHGSKSIEVAIREHEFFFPSDGSKRSHTAKCSECTLCIIKPHAVNAGMAGRIIEAIQSNGFKITMAKMVYLEKANAEEFLEVYRGVLYEYQSMVDEMRLGPCIAMEITGGPNVQKDFREFVGPMDPEIARHLRPGTLRARFGKDKIKNSIHCTDLPDDGVLEVEYFFKIIG